MSVTETREGCVKLSECLDVVMGQAPASRNCNKTGKGVPFVKAGEFRLLRPEICEWTDDPLKRAKDGDVLLCVVGATCGKINLGIDCAIGRSVAALRPKPNLLQQYLYYFMMTQVLSLRGGSTGAAQTVISKDMIFDLEIPLPPLAEQKRIVALLDKAFAGIDEARAKAEANLENAGSLFNNLRECLMKEPEADVPSHGFDEICKINSVLVDPREEENANKLHVGGANIESKTGRLLELQTARQEGLKSGKFPFERGMVLYSKIRPKLMKVARPNFGGLCSADMYPLDPNKALICGDYLYHLLLTERFTRFALLGSERAGMPKVNRDYLSKFSTKLPTVHEQKTLAMKLDSMEQALGELRELLTMKISSLTELKSSLLAQAFAGELTA